MKRMKDTLLRGLGPIMIVLAVGAIVAGTSALAGEQGEHGKKMEAKLDKAKTVIPVKGMTCGGCSSAVTVAVKKLDGVLDVAVSHEKGEAAVTYVKGKVTVKQIVEAINKTGFEAKEPEAKKG